MRVLRPRSGSNSEVRNGAGQESGSYREGQIAQYESSDRRDQIMMDGLTRQEVAYKPLCISRSSEQTRREDDWDSEMNREKNEDVVTPYVRAYLVGGRDVLKTWERNPSVVVLLPDILSQSHESEPDQGLQGGEEDHQDGRHTRAERERQGKGWRSRGLRVMADELAFNMQCIVIVPDLARGIEKCTCQ